MTGFKTNIHEQIAQEWNYQEFFQSLNNIIFDNSFSKNVYVVKLYSVENHLNIFASTRSSNKTQIQQYRWPAFKTA